MIFLGETTYPHIFHEGFGIGKVSNLGEKRGKCGILVNEEVENLFLLKKDDNYWYITKLRYTRC